MKAIGHLIKADCRFIKANGHFVKADAALSRLMAAMAALSTGSGRMVRCLDVGCGCPISYCPV